VVIQGPTVSPFDVFLSYSAKDKAVADAMVATLEAHGLRCWIAPRDIVPGKAWSQAIIEGLEQCRLVVLIFSQYSNQSQQVIREVERAVHKAIPIIPFRIEDVQASKAMEYFISTHHWLDAYRPPLDEHLEKLAANAKVLLAGGAAPREEGPKNLKAHLRAAVRALLARDNRTRVLVAASILLVLVGALVVGLTLALRDPKAKPEQVQARADAEVLVEELKTYDPGQGFHGKVQEIENDLKTGQGFFGEKNFTRAQDAFARALAKGSELKGLEKKRQEARAARTRMLEARQEAEKANAAKVSPAPWAEAEQQQRDGQQDYERGDFVAAARSWNLAVGNYGGDLVQLASANTAREAFETLRKKPGYQGLDTEAPEEFKYVQALAAAAEQAANARRHAEAAEAYKEARRELRLTALPRMKALAFAAGLHGRNLWWAAWARTLTSGATPFPSGIPTPRPTGIQPPARPRITIDIGLDIKELKEVCWPGLDLDPALLQNLLTESSPSTLSQSLRDRLPQVIRETADLGSGVEKAYALGHDLNLVNEYCRFRASNNFLNPIRTEPFSIGEFHLLVDRLSEAGYHAGVTREAIVLLERFREQVRTANLRLDDDISWQRLLREYEPLLQKLFQGANALKTFRQAQTQGLPLPAETQVVAHLRRERAALHFDDPSKPSPLVRVYLFTPLKDPNRTLNQLKDLATLQSLSLGSNPVTDDGLRSLAGLKELRDLSLSRSRVTDAGLSHLRGLNRLEKLYLNDLPITDRGLEHLKGLSSLRELEVFGTGVTQTGADHLSAALPRLALTGFEGDTPTRKKRLALVEGKAEAAGTTSGEEPVTYQVKLKGGKSYRIELESSDFQPILTVLDEKEMTVAEQRLNRVPVGTLQKVQVTVQPKTDETFDIRAGCYRIQSGRFVLRIREE
jgi:hypothetical protein